VLLGPKRWAVERPLCQKLVRGWNTGIDPAVVDDTLPFDVKYAYRGCMACV